MFNLLAKCKSDNIWITIFTYGFFYYKVDFSLGDEASGVEGEGKVKMREERADGERDNGKTMHKI